MNKILVYVICFFFIIGGIDYIFGNRFKIGEKFEEGIKTMGVLGIGMIGIYSLGPVLSKLLSKIIVPAANILNIDPSIIAASFFGLDLGGYQMAMDMALTKEMGLFSSILLSSTLGVTISYSIPVAIGMIEKDDFKFYSKGVMVGFIIIPFECFIGGIIQGLNINIILWNLLPIFIFSILLGTGMMLIPQILTSGFNILGKFITGLSIIGLLIQGIYGITGINLLPDMASFTETLALVGKVTFVLVGSYTMLYIINKLFKNVFERIGNKLGLNSESVCGIVGNLASNLLVFSTYKDMNPKGKVVCAACTVTAPYVIGGQLGFVSSLQPGMITPYVITKLIGCVISIVLASLIFDLEARKNKARALETNSLRD